MGQLLSQPAAEPPQPKAAEAPRKPSLNAKTMATTIPMRTTISNAENDPVVIEDDLSDSTIVAVKPRPKSQALSKAKSSHSLYSYKQYRPAPAVVYTQHEEEANDLVQTLKGPLGFDLEWVVNFRRGKKPSERRTALVQLSDARMILLIQVSSMKKFPQKVKEVIENKDIIKLGANIRNDGQKLFRDFGLHPAGLVELGALAGLADPSFKQTYNRSIVALAKVVEHYTHKTLDKGKVRTSNWDAKLSQAQITYAANDAHCALSVYNVLMAVAAGQQREVDWRSCAADLAVDYREKCVVNAQAAPTIPSQAAMTSGADGGADGPQGSASMSAPTFTQSQSQPERRVWNPFARQPSSCSTSSSQTWVQREPPRPQHLRAYNLWYHRDMPLADICAALRSKDNPLAESTVISYVVRALQADPSLPFSMERLKAFVQLEAGSWRRHRDWIFEKDGYKKA
ncbi:ribonuclease H-like protein [Dichomitus squalens LYAD-421 SS1]|uniref:Ribonuclease H-like protein n=1 Tax=Dichomitus squalens (strain LYAD-421) TaxID=732165 RepID=R7SV89_DICSQ|nr:ribonuclease H-like protein [Dichomitus squalens LYAD-421 SS1]EJF59660.1 ribonuclease H-like protein [Dichomitus squalens LYAD-421 SS1]